MSAEKTKAMLSLRAWTTLATVLATAVPTTKYALKLKKAENQGAHRAGRARVATTVATEFAASWKPLVKSKSSANATTATTVISRTSMDRSPQRARGRACPILSDRHRRIGDR